jgi:RNA polymerase sigma factor (sigma-70 family)
MVGRSREGYVKSLATLLDLGTLVSLTDSQLLGRFLDRGGASAEPAFEALVVRHGPMVHRVCRGIVGPGADADDAFQATFLILACRASAVRRRDSLESWLFGVARRVSRRARSDAARRRVREREAALNSAGDSAPAAPDPDYGWLIDEVHRLPAKYREVVLLCDLQGLTYEAAAGRLGCPLGTVSIRLKRARERLRARLERRGIMDPAGLLISAGGPPASLMAEAVKSSVRLAVAGSLAARVAPSSAALLAREVLMLMNMARFKVAFLWMIPLALGVGVLAWQHADARPAKPDVRRPAVRVVKRRQAPPAPAKKAEAAYRMVGTVRVEGTGEPVAGAKVMVRRGGSGPEAIATVDSGPDGKFAVDLPQGHVMPWTLPPPVGYWSPNPAKDVESIVLSAAEPIHRKDYELRKGTVWEFRIGEDAKVGPFRGFSSAHVTAPEGFARSVFGSNVDARGHVRQTLPTEGGEATVVLGPEPMLLANIIKIELEWASDFRPDSVEAVAEFKDKPGHFRLTDAAGKTATLSGVGLGRPTIEAGKLAVRVKIATPDPLQVGDLSGRVIDALGKPVEGARVNLVFVTKGSSGMSSIDSHNAKTDATGGFRLGSIPRKHFFTGGPTSISIVVSKDGFAGVDTPAVVFNPPAGGPLVIEPIRIEPEATVRGTVVGPDGAPRAGVWVEPGGSFATRGRSTKTDDAGRFTVRGLPEGMMSLAFHYGKLDALGNYLAERDPEGDEVEIRLKPLPDPSGTR